MPDPTNAERQCAGWTPLDSCTVQSISVWEDGEHKLLWEARPTTLSDRVPRMAIETTTRSDPAPAIDVQASEINTTPTIEPMTTNLLTKHLHELGFTIIAETIPGQSRVHFNVYDIEGWQEGENAGVYDVPVWHKAGSDSYPDTVERIAEAERYLWGTVKWDGCSDWYFDEQDRVMLHGCSRQGVFRFGEVMAACWDWAAELCPGWNPR